MSREIRFYDPVGEFGWLSNFFIRSFLLDGVQWPSVEHYYQASKFRGSAHYQKICGLQSPGAAKAMAKKLKSVRLDDWTQIKDSIMLSALRAKFSQNDDLASLLVATFPSRLIEESMEDMYWGCGAHEEGANRLGQLLGQVRDEIMQSR